jgi:hypothetical protein
MQENHENGGASAIPQEYGASLKIDMSLDLVIFKSDPCNVSAIGG